MEVLISKKQYKFIKVCEYCNSIDSYDYNGLCTHCGGNSYIEKKIETGVDTYKDIQKPITKAIEDDKSKKNYLGIALVLFVCFIFVICIACWIGALINNEPSYTERFHVGEHTCIYCGSNDTEGYHVYWHEDGTICGGDDEYKNTHADYVWIDCKHCGKDFKYYLKTGEYKK